MLAFLALYMLTLPVLIFVLFFGVIFSMAEYDGWAVFTGIVAAVIAFFMFDVSPTQILYYGLAYFATGVVWSFWRYKRYAEKMVDKINKEQDAISRKCMVGELSISNMSGVITAWILSWPFSMIENVVGDVLRLIKNFVTNTMKSVYNRILTSATKNIVPLGESKQKIEEKFDYSSR
jgi:membrane protein implicated in regulation of membrane protease activity